MLFAYQSETLEFLNSWLGWILFAIILIVWLIIERD
jgi:hypothetical protein